MSGPFQSDRRPDHTRGQNLQFASTRDPELDAQRVIDIVVDWPLAEIRDLRYKIGAALHDDLLQMQREGLIQGLAIADGACPGMVGDVLASCDGSSKYLRFSLNLNSSEAQRAAAQTGEFDSAAFARTQLEYLTRFGDRHNLQANRVLAVNGWVSGANAGRFTVTCGDEIFGIQATPHSSVTSDHDRQRLRECAAIGCLVTMIDQASRAGMNSSFAITKRLLEDQELPDRLTEPNEFGRRAETLRLLNIGYWAELYDVLKQTSAPGIAVGESFTFGKLGRLLTSLPGSTEQVSFMYGWYYPDAKQVFGVDPEQLSEEKIAEPLTVVQGARGLIEQGFGKTGLSIGTSGWANNSWLVDHTTGEVNDFFSVAAATRRDNGGFDTRALRVSLPDTAGLPASPERRRMTRELGVTAGLVALAQVYPVASPRGARALANLTSQLKDILTRHSILQEF